MHGSRYKHAGYGGCTYATAHEKVRELGSSVGVGGVAQESDAAVSDALIFQLQAVVRLILAGVCHADRGAEAQGRRKAAVGHLLEAGVGAVLQPVVALQPRPLGRALRAEVVVA